MLKKSHVDNVLHLSDAAKAGNWSEVFRLLDEDDWLSANQWRIGGDSWFAPLNQAAWHGASTEVIEELLRRGAWRAMRNADGERPLDIAVKQGHSHLLDVLAVPEPSESDQNDLHFRFPGMYGGFTMSIDESRLVVASCSRVVGGS